MKKESTTQYAILGALSVRPMSGYDVKKWITETTSTFWSESLGQIYPTLSKLLENKSVKVESDDGVGNRPKKMYKITDKGQLILESWLKLPPKPLVERNEFILKMFYGKSLSKEDYLTHLYRQKQFAQDERLRFETIEQKHKKDNDKNIPEHFYWLLILKRAFLDCEAEIAWCDEAIAAIKRKN